MRGDRIHPPPVGLVFFAVPGHIVLWDSLYRQGKPGAEAPHAGDGSEAARAVSAMFLYGGENMDVDLIFKIAAVGILVAVLNLLLSRSGRDEQALMTTIAGLVVVLVIIVREISDLFTLIKSLFGL